MNHLLISSRSDPSRDPLRDTLLLSKPLPSFNIRDRHSRALRGVAISADPPQKILAVSWAPFCFAVGMRCACVNEAVLRIVLRLVCGSGGG